jgi:Spy/CpxP family protein refolding chaperone
LIDAQQREVELNACLAETRQELNQLISANNSDSISAALQRTIETMQKERTNVSLILWSFI